MAKKVKQTAGDEANINQLDLNQLDLNQSVANPNAVNTDVVHSHAINQGQRMQTEENQLSNNHVEINAQHYSRCGGALRSAREQAGLTVHDIASRLRLSPKQILAIEADNFAALPEPTIVRGFIRNYAKQLKIEAEPLLDAYKVLVPEKSPYAFSVKPNSTLKVTNYEKPKTGRYIWAGFLILLGLSAWLFYQNYVQKPGPNLNTTAPSATDANGINAEVLPQPALPAAERAEPAPAAIELNLPPANATGGNGDVMPSTNASSNALSNTLASPTAKPTEVAPNNAANAAEPALAPVSIPSPAPIPSTAQPSATLPSNILPSATPLSAAPLLPALNASASKLEVTANQETWVSVTDGTGKEVYKKIIFAGSRETIDVAPPASIVVGNAGGASLTMNGKVVDLAPHTRGNVARLKLD